MSWSAEFISELAERRRQPVYRLLVHDGYSATGYQSGQSPPGQPVVLTSASGYGETIIVAGAIGLIQIGQQIRVSGTRVEPSSWLVSIGQWTVELCGAIQHWRARCPRGALCSLEMGFVGWDVSRFQRVALGRFQLCTSEGLGGGVRHFARFWDAGAMIQHRIAESYAKVQLFHDVGGGSTANAGYSPGDAVLTVAATIGFSRESSGIGVVRVTPTTGDPFFLKYDGITGNDLDLNPTGADVFGTLRTAALVGDKVEHIAYLYGHPLDIVRKVLISGNGSPSTWNVLGDPSSIRLPLDMVDTNNIDVWKAALSVSGGAYHWEVLATEPQDNAWTWLTTLLAVDGIWPVMRRGDLSVRYAQDPAAPLVGAAASIDPSHLLGSWRLVDWDSQQPAEYSQVSVGTLDNHNVGTVATKATRVDALVRSAPLSLLSQTHDFTDRIYNATNGPLIAQSTIDRLSPWSFNIGERLTLSVRLDFARLCAGDLVSATLPVHGRTSATQYGYEQQPCMVVAVDADYTGGVCMIELLTIEG